MAKMRVHELAKELNIKSQDILDKLKIQSLTEKVLPAIWKKKHRHWSAVLFRKKQNRQQM